MAEKSAPAPAAPADAKDAPSKKGGMKVMIVAGIVVALEVATVFVTMSLAGGPKNAHAEVPVTPTTKEVEREVEVKLIAAKLPNTQSGRLVMYDLAVVAKVSETNKEKVTGLFAEREAEIKDRIRTIIASSDPKNLAEPSLETLRRQINYQLEHIIGKDLIKELLIPTCTAVRWET